MKVQILNYSDSESVDMELVLLRGHIEDLEVTGVDSSKFRIKLVGETSGQSCYVRLGSMRVIQDSFSILLTLFQGSNLISFHYKSQLIDEFHLIYQDASTLNFIPYKVKPLIVYSECLTSGTPHCTDGFLSYFSQIDLGLKLVQWYFSEKLVEAGFPRRSFSLTNCSTFILSITPAEIESMTSNEVWEALAVGIRTNPGLWSEEYKYVAFLLHPWKHVTSEVSSSVFALEPKSAVAGGGLVLLDHKVLFSWPRKLDEIFTALDDPREVPDHTSLTPLMSTVGRQFGATLGIVAHELGHVFDLGHEHGGNLMGTDFHRFALTFQPKIKTTLGVKTKRVYLSRGSVSEDPVQLCPSFLTLLHYNRWFHDSGTTVVAAGSDSRISLEKNLILSATNISVIEVRDPDSSIVISAWTEDRTQGRTSFILSKRFVPIDWVERRVELVVQNVSGTILKADVNFCEFPQGATPIKRTNN